MSDCVLHFHKCLAVPHMLKIRGQMNKQAHFGVVLSAFTPGAADPHKAKKSPQGHRWDEHLAGAAVQPVVDALPGRRLHTSLLGPPAAVVRHRGDVHKLRQPQPCRRQALYRVLLVVADALHLHGGSGIPQLDHTPRQLLGRLLSSYRQAFARILEADAATGYPGKHAARSIGEGEDHVAGGVEHVNDAMQACGGCTAAQVCDLPCALSIAVLLRLGGCCRRGGSG